ncbi:MAG: hypothetical protein HDR29_07215 [Lachnospiraceae bacterium]|nr:hypothetical protein [Lachnospiraceae bacterium]
MKTMKKALAVAMSTVMVIGTSMTTFAAEPEVSVDAPIYAYDITNVVVPTNFLVAFNPDGLDVKKAEGDVVQDQIVSKNYGIINKSTKDKIITVAFDVEDLNEDKITFAEDASEVTSAVTDDYVINLQVIPANATEVEVASGAADLTTTGADLADAKMTAATSAAKTLVAGENYVDFLLSKAAYTGTIDLSSADTNNVTSDFTIDSLATSGKGITAFTFGGTMNTNTDWTKLTKGIKITAVYDSENAPSGATAVTGTGALYELPNPVFKTGSDVGTIKYRTGSGNGAMRNITSIKMDLNGTLFDGYHAASKLWVAATDKNGTIKFDSKYLAFFTKAYPNDIFREATVTYEVDDPSAPVGSAEPVTATATVNIRLKEDPKPSFVAGAGIGTINYTVGGGNDAVASIQKVEMDLSGKLYDGYKANGSTWSAATDANGLITLDSKYVAFFTKGTNTTQEATITYVTVGGETKTATVDVKVK